ncbi:MAG: hypothetical protein GY769_12700 [bacterium]|nr:hypothetical protein [bacterium]
MSLVNDALKKARLEAARGDAGRRGIPYPVFGRGEQAPSGLWFVALGAVILLAGIGGFLLYRAGKQSALSEQVVERRPLTGADSAADESPVAPVAPVSAASSASETEAAQAPATESPPLTANPEPEPEPEPARKPPARPAAPPEGPRTEGVPLRADTPANGQQEAEAAPTRSAGSASPRPTRQPAPPEPRRTAAEPGVAGPSSEPGEPPPSEPAGDGTAVEPPEQEYLQRADVPGVGSVELGGIAWSGDRPFALVNGRVVSPGDTVSGLVVDDIQPNTVRLRGDNGTLIFRLK